MSPRLRDRNALANSKERNTFTPTKIFAAEKFSRPKISPGRRQPIASIMQRPLRSLTPSRSMRIPTRRKNRLAMSRAVIAMHAVTPKKLLRSTCRNNNPNSPRQRFSRRYRILQPSHHREFSFPRIPRLRSIAASSFPCLPFRQLRCAALIHSRVAACSPRRLLFLPFVLRNRASWHNLVCPPRPPHHTSSFSQVTRSGLSPGNTLAAARDGLNSWPPIQT